MLGLVWKALVFGALMIVALQVAGVFGVKT